MSGVTRLAMAENKGVKPLTNAKLKEEGVQGAEVEKKGELY